MSQVESSEGRWVVMSRSWPTLIIRVGQLCTACPYRVYTL